MRLTRSVEYALRAVLYLAWRRGRLVSASEIATRQNIPRTALPGLMNFLIRKGIVQSRAGPKGGYALAGDPVKITLRRVIEAVEGPLFENECLVHGAPCPAAKEHWCPAHEVWEEAGKTFLSTLDRYSVKELADRLGRWDSVQGLLKNLAAGN